MAPPVTRGEMLRAATNAGAMIEAIYTYVDRVKAAGGATTISGIAACHTMIESLEKNRHRTEGAILAPLRQAIADAERERNERDRP